MKNCKYCLYDSNHPFGMSFYNEECLGCKTHKEKYNIDWAERYGYLQEEVKKAKKKNKTYDCVVPVTGDAEDYFVIQEVLKLGMNPLVVSVNSYFYNDIGWSNLHNLITHFDLDSWVYNPEKQTYQELIRTSLRKYNHMYLPWLQLHTSFPVHVANEKSIPLIVWGGHQSIEQVGKFSHNDSVEMSSWSRIEHDLFGKNIESLIGNGAQVNERKLNYYHYPDDLKKLSKKVKGLYLSNYLPWDPLKQNHSMVLKHGFKPEANPYSFDPYERAGSSVYYEIHDLLKYERLGYRKISDHCTREIRHGRITKNEGIDLQHFLTTRKVNIDPFFNWLNVTKSGVDWYIKHRLNKSSNLISRNKVEHENIKLPKKLKVMISNSSEPILGFINYGKGLKI
ncbi:N-acetyl sugar amidotransferase [Flavobacteriaceae bacterium]|nr:N-acetyl sugar amidotransferase [Flavobacteriaceae bacterium]